jgi:hypothetical protein
VIPSFRCSRGTTRVILYARQKLSDRDTLIAETNRLIDSDHIGRFVSNFTGQWLGLRRLEDITPDPRFIAWQPGHRKGMIGEAERSFTEILRTNRPLATFIKPDFTWDNERLLNEIYGQKVKIPNWGFDRIEIPDGAKFGGLLAQAGVLMATSNGTETQPVERGVWVLRNILGDPPPPRRPALPPSIPIHAAPKRSATSWPRTPPMPNALPAIARSIPSVSLWRTTTPSDAGAPTTLSGQRTRRVSRFEKMVHQSNPMRASSPKACASKLSTICAGKCSRISISSANAFPNLNVDGLAHPRVDRTVLPINGLVDPIGAGEHMAVTQARVAIIHRPDRKLAAVGHMVAYIHLTRRQNHPLRHDTPFAFAVD